MPNNKGVCNVEKVGPLNNEWVCIYGLVPNNVSQVPNNDELVPNDKNQCLTVMNLCLIISEQA